MIIFKYFSLFFLITFSTFASEPADVCTSSWSESDKDEKMAGHLKEICRIESNQSAIQVMLYKRECQRFEGASKQDCFFVRECGGEESSLRMSPPIYDTKSFINGICKKDQKDFELLSQDTHRVSEEKLSAHIDCQNANKFIILKLEDKQKKCKFPF